MADETTNYGVKLQEGTGVGELVYADIADIVSIDPPAIESSAVESTNHGSLGKKQFVPSGLVGYSEFGMTINYTKNCALESKVGTLVHLKMLFPNTKSWTFDAVLLSFKPGESDAQNPNALQAEISLQPTGDCVITVVP